MASSTTQEHKISEHRRQKPDIKDWPELMPVRSALTPEQALALEVVKKRAENANKLLIARSKALLIATVLAFLSVVHSVFQVVPGLLHGDAGVGTLLLAFNMVLQLSAVGYFLRAKDPGFASQLVRLMLILNGLVLFLGFAWLGISPLTVAILILLYVAYRRMEQLKYGGD